MNTAKRGKIPKAGRLATTLMLVLATTGALPAQNVIAPGPTAPVNTPAQRNQLPPVPASQPALTSGTPFQAGPVTFRPHALYRYLNAEGLPAGTRRVASEIQTSAIGLAVDLGQNWTLDYSPTWTWYTARALDDTLDHAVSIQGGGDIQDWNLQFSENFGIASPTLAETAQQTKQRNWATSLGASHQFGSIASVQLGASLNEQYGDLFPDTREWSTQNWLSLQPSPRVEVAFGPGAGYVDIVHSPDATYERYLGRVNWRPTDKISLGLNGGMEYRHSRSSAGKDLRNPLLDASLDYQPFTTTGLGLTYSRSVKSSYFRDQVTEGSSWHVRLEQRLLGRLYLNVDWGRQRSDYSALTTTVPVLPEAPVTDLPEDPVAPALLLSLPGRADRVDSLNARLSVVLFGRLSVAASYNENKNQSNDTRFNFSSKQYGVEFGIRY